MAATIRCSRLTAIPVRWRMALCWAHVTPQFFDARPTSPRMRKRGSNATPISPMALEAVKRIDAAVRHRARDQQGLPPNNAWSTVGKHSLPLRRQNCTTGSQTETGKTVAQFSVAEADRTTC